MPLAALAAGGRDRVQGAGDKDEGRKMKDER